MYFLIDVGIMTRHKQGANTGHWLDTDELHAADRDLLKAQKKPEDCEETFHCGSEVYGDGRRLLG